MITKEQVIAKKYDLIYEEDVNKLPDIPIKEVIELMHEYSTAKTAGLLAANENLQTIIHNYEKQLKELIPVFHAPFRINIEDAKKALENTGIEFESNSYRNHIVYNEQDWLDVQRQQSRYF